MNLKKWSIFLLCLIQCNMVFASDSSQFCSRFSTESDRASVIKSLLDKKNLLRYINVGGFPQTVIPNLQDLGLPKIEGWGVCWWHSRFLRAATYLVKYAPEKAKPKTTQEIKRLIKLIAQMKSVVEIPGYANLFDFSTDHFDYMQEEFNDWQKRDTLNGVRRAINPFRPSVNIYNESLEETLYRLNVLVNEEKVLPFVLEQVPGIGVHSYLVVKVEVEGATNYEKKTVLTLIDSDAPFVKKAILDPESGNRLQFINTQTGKFEKRGYAIYIDFNRDLVKIENALKQFCPQTTIKIAPSFIDNYEY